MCSSSVSASVQSIASLIGRTLPKKSASCEGGGREGVGLYWRGRGSQVGGCHRGTDQGKKQMEKATDPHSPPLRSSPIQGAGLGRTSTSIWSCSGVVLSNKLDKTLLNSGNENIT